MGSVNCSLSKIINLWGLKITVYEKLHILSLRIETKLQKKTKFYSFKIQLTYACDIFGDIQRNFTTVLV